MQATSVREFPSIFPVKQRYLAETGSLKTACTASLRQRRKGGRRVRHDLHRRLDNVCLYVGSTNDLKRRAASHEIGQAPSTAVGDFAFHASTFRSTSLLWAAVNSDSGPNHQTCIRGTLIWRVQVRRSREFRVGMPVMQKTRSDHKGIYSITFQIDFFIIR